MKTEVIFLFAAILIVGALVLVAIELTKRRPNKKIDVEKYRVKWLEIQNQIQRGDDQANASAVVNADKLLDHSLKSLGYEGLTMAERLKSVKNRKLSDKQAVWQAHRLRNQVVHEIDMKVSYDKARWALGVYKKALKELGAI